MLHARTDVHHILASALALLCGRSRRASCCQRAGQGYSNRTAEIADSMETPKKKMEERLADLCHWLDQARTLAGDTASSMQALQEENKRLKTTMQAAEKAIDELVAVVDKEKQQVGSSASARAPRTATNDSDSRLVLRL